MEFNEIIKYLAEHLEIDIDTEYQDCSNNQVITVKLKIGDNVISERSTIVFFDT